MIIHEFDYCHKVYSSVGDYSDRNGVDYSAYRNNVIVVSGTPRTHAEAIELIRYFDSPNFRGRKLLRSWLKSIMPNLDLQWLSGWVCECSRCRGSR